MLERYLYESMEYDTTDSSRYITHVYIRNGEDRNEIMQPIEIDME